MEMLTRSEKMKHFGIHLGSWLLSTSLAFGCGSGIYFLCQYEQQVPTFIHDYNLKQGCLEPVLKGHNPAGFCVLPGKKTQTWFLFIDLMFSLLCQLRLVMKTKQILHQTEHYCLLLTEHNR